MLRTGVLEDMLAMYPAARKLSWAAGRQTTRIEDRAYSLVGLFGVNMPLLYGEGHKEFKRLQEEILDMGTDLSILAWEPTRRVIDCLLFSESPEQYAGCSDMKFSNPHGQQPKEGMVVSLTNIGLRIENPQLFEFSIYGIKRLALNLGCYYCNLEWQDAVLRLSPMYSPLCRVDYDDNMGLLAARQDHSDIKYDPHRTPEIDGFRFSLLKAWPILIITRGESYPPRRQFEPV